MCRATVLGGAVALVGFTQFAVGLGAQTSSGRQATVVSRGTNLAFDAHADGTFVHDLQGTLWRFGDGWPDSTALSDGLGDDRQPSISPDGSRVAFQSYRDGIWNIWSSAIDGSDPVRHTTGPFDDREPDYSPDGGSIVFSSDRAGNYDLWTLELSTGELTQVTSDEANDYAPAYAPDGDAVYFVSERAPARAESARSGTAVWRVSLDGSKSPEIVHRDLRQLNAPSPSPDGRWLAFQALNPVAGTAELLLAEYGASGWQSPHRLSREGEEVFPFRASWTDSVVLYSANGRIRKMSLDGENLGEVAFRARLEFDRPGYTAKDRNLEGDLPVLGIVAPATSPRGEQIAFSALGDLWLTDRQGELVRLTDDVAVDVYPRWSPDGKRLVFVSDRRGDMDVWEIDVETRELRALSTMPGQEAYPSYDPSGRRVAFFAEDVGGFLSARLQVLELSGEASTVAVGPTMPPTEISWRPDGGAVVVTRLKPNSTRFREGAYRALEMTLDSEVRDVSPAGELTLMEARRSPDGRFLAYVRDGGLFAQPFVRGELDGEPMLLSDGIVDSPSWSANGRFLTFLAGDRLVQLELDDALQVTSRVEIRPQLEASALPPGEATLIRAGRLFNGVDLEPQVDVDIVLRGGVIETVAPHDATRVAEFEGNVVDASDKTVLPGLIEMHAHQAASFGQRLGRTWLAFGITSVREPGTDPYEARERKESWRSGRRLGPREFFAGTLLDGSRVYYSIAEGTDSSTHLDVAIERAKVLEYDLIKTYVRLPDGEQVKVVEAAHELGIPTSSHEIYPASRSGMDAVEHASATSRRGYSPKLSLLGQAYDDVVRIVADSGLNMTPTLVLPCFWPVVAEEPEILEHPTFQAFYSPQLAEVHVRRGRQMRGPAMLERCKKQSSIADMVRRGGRITVGTDSPIVPYGISLHVELQLFVNAGLTPAEALRSATSWSAEALGEGDRLGRVAAGYLADLIITGGDPLTDIRDTLAVETVFRSGRRYEVGELRSPP